MHRLPLVLALISAGMGSGCDTRPDPEPPTTREESGHARMIEVLARAAEEAHIHNPYMGLAKLPALREELAALSDEPPDERHWYLRKLIARNELRLGQVESAVENLLVAYQLQRGDAARDVPAREAATLIFELGLAYLRLGEVENCALRHTADSCLLPIRGGGVHIVKEPSRNAVRYLAEVLEIRGAEVGTRIKARWLLNIAYMTLGEYPEKVPPSLVIPPEIFASDEPFPRFDDVAPELGLNSFDLAGGAVVDDFDNDGDLDLATSTSAPDGPMGFYVNRGDGTFQKRDAGLEGLTGGLNMIQADYDNDGFVDLLVLRGAWWRSAGRVPNSLLRNNGDNTFTDVTFEAGLGEKHNPGQTGAWGDFDNDGDLDLYLGNEQDPETPAPCQLFRNEGDGTFVDIAAAAGVENGRYAKGAVWGDYDGDRLPDLYVSNLNKNNRLYHNNGDGTFTDQAEAVGVTRPIASFPTWFWDYDNDGSLDLFAAAYGGPNLPHDVASVAATFLGIRSRAERPQIYRGDGRGGFEALPSERIGLHRVSLPMGANFGDVDYDGYPDFYLGTGYPYYEALMPNVMYRNRRGEGFADVTTAGGFGHLQKGHGIAFADIDADGDQDVFAQIGGMYLGDAFGNALFRNPGFGNHWIAVRLVGVQSNRSAIGVRIRADITEDGVRRSVFRHVNSGGSFGGSPLRQEVGLGRATTIDRLEVYWPTSDRTHLFENVAVDQSILLVEDESAYRPWPDTGH